MARRYFITSWGAVIAAGIRGAGCALAAAALVALSAPTPAAAQTLQNLSTLTPRGAVAGTDMVPLEPHGGVLLERETVAGLRDFVLGSVKNYGAVCDGSTDDHAAIQSAINAAQAASPTGGLILFPNATCYLGTVGLSITGNSVHLVGQGGGALSNTGTTLTYGGSGAAITVGGQSAFNYNDQIDYLQIQAVGTAISSSTASGLVLNNSQYFISHGLGVYNFQAGPGVVSQANGSGYYTASNSFYDVNIYNNLVGVRSTVVNSGTGENILGIHGGWIIGRASSGSPIAGSIGLDLQASNAGVFENIDVETFAIGFKVGSTATAGGNRFMGTHGEFNTQEISLLAGSIHNVFQGHHAAESGGYASVWSDAGTDNHYYGSNDAGMSSIVGLTQMTPSVDAAGVLNITNAAQQSVVDISTNGTPRMEFPFGRNMLFYTDAFTTISAGVYGATGQVVGYSEALRPAADAGEILLIKNAAGTGYFDFATNGGGNLGVINGASISGYFGSFVNPTWNLTSPSSGNGLLTINGSGAAAITLTGSNGHVAATAFNGIIGDVSPAAANFTTAAASTSYSLNGKLLFTATAPTYSSGFSSGTPTIAGATPAAFSVTLGATPGATGVLTLPAASTDWVCFGSDRTTGAGSIRETASTPTSVTFALSGTVASDVLQFACAPR